MKLIHSMNAYLREIKHIAHVKQILSNLQFHVRDALHFRLSFSLSSFQPNMEKARSITVVCWTFTLTFIKGPGNRALAVRDKYFFLYISKQEIHVSNFDNDIYYFSLLFFEDIYYFSLCYSLKKIKTLTELLVKKTSSCKRKSCTTRCREKNDHFSIISF